MASYTLRDIDNSFWHQVKILAVTKGITIRQLILDLLRQAVKGGE